jgi:hypothetical protein
VRKSGAREVEGAEQHDADEALPGLDRELLDWRDVLQPGVIHEDVDAAEVADRPRHERIAVRLLGRIRALKCGGRELPGHAFAFLDVYVGEQHMYARLGEINRDRLADPAGCSRDDRSASLHRNAQSRF